MTERNEYYTSEEYYKRMPKAEVVRLLRRYLLEHAGEECDAQKIYDDTGVPKKRIDPGGSFTKRHDNRKIETEGEADRWKSIAKVKPDLMRDGLVKFDRKEFERWVPWKHRSEHRTVKPRGGVYLFGHFAKDPKGSNLKQPSRKDLPEQVVYIGSTHHLNDRPLKTHSHLDKFRDVFRDPDLKRLYISVCRFEETNDDLAYVFRPYNVYVEAQLIWEYTKKFGHHPKLHFKEPRN